MVGYVALVHKDEGTSYGVSFPDLPGCISAGDTMDEALANAAEALAGHLALMRSDGDVVGKPRSISAVRGDATLADDLDGAECASSRRRASASALRGEVGGVAAGFRRTFSSHATCLDGRLTGVAMTWAE